MPRLSKNDEFCIKNEEFCIKNEKRCIKNEEMMNFANGPACGPWPMGGCRSVSSF